MIPSHKEAYDESDIDDSDSEDRQEMLNLLYEDIEDMEECFHEVLNEADNTVAQIIWPHWEKLTDLCALLKREMYSLSSENEEE